jgi:transcription elongation factor Elf1
MILSYTHSCDNSFYLKLSFKPKVITDINSPLIDRSKMKCLCDVCGASCERISDWRVMNQSFRAIFQCTSCKRKIRFTIRFKEYYDRVDIKSSTVPFIDKKELEAKAATNENAERNENNENISNEATTTEV